MERVLHLIVVDDDSSRLNIFTAFAAAYNASRTYKRFSLNLQCVFKNHDALDLIRQAKGIRLVLLDMVLAGWQRDQLRSLLIDTATPIIALSEHFNSSEATREYTYYAEQLSRPPPIIHFRDVRDAFTKKQWESVLDVFATHIGVLFALDHSADWPHDRSVNVVHMTDVHMNDMSLTSDELKDIGAALQRNERNLIDLRADFLAITGDLTDRGGVQQFKVAPQRVRDLFSAGWMQDRTPTSIPSARVLACPGNHDFSEQLAGARLLERDGSSKPHPTGFRLPTTLPALRASDDWRFGMLPFAGFHRAVTGFTGWELGEVPGFRISSAFRAQGLIFLELWAQPFRCGAWIDVTPPEWIKRAVSGAGQAVDDHSANGDTIVVLMHHLSTENPSTIDTAWLRMLNKISMTRSVILLTGHLHNSNAQPISFSDGKMSGVLHVRTDTMNTKSVREGTLPSFAVLRLLRENFGVVTCEVHRIELKSIQGWTRNDQRTTNFNFINGAWRGAD